MVWFWFPPLVEPPLEIGITPYILDVGILNGLAALGEDEDMVYEEHEYEDNQSKDTNSKIPIIS